MVWDDFTVVNGMLEISRIKPGQSFQYDTTYDSMNCRWYPIGRFETHTKPNDVPLANEFLLKQSPMDVGFIEANYATLVNHNFLDESKPLMVKIEVYHSEQGAIRIIAKIKVTYTTVIEYQTKVNLGFNVPHIGPDEAKQLMSEGREEQTAIPHTHYNFNNPRLLMGQGGLQYSAKNRTTIIGDTSGLNPQPPLDSHERTISEHITETLANRNIVPDTEDPNSVVQNWSIPRHTSTPVAKRQVNKYKRKAADPAESKAKRYKVVDGAIEHQTQPRQPILPVRLTPSAVGSDWEMFTSLAKETVVDFVPEEGAASTQDKTLRSGESRWAEKWSDDSENL